ncbi:SCO family protein [Alteromonas sediminis]|uniref:SCO family protein n=1 Tax=Alteromonas sediminis TaxID=2259342 RepID=A0A3N5Z758_9ALTE|nr:SCO family protein [Alteromonas sediminis]RPJ66514.1 SCO family protein [Alteromonas sediminis]
MSQKTIVGIVAAIALIAGIIASVYVSPPGDISAVGDRPEYMQVYPAPRALSDFTLTQHTGAPFTVENLKQHWTLAFIGYTYCPDICPVTMSALAGIYPELKEMEGNAPIQVVFISVDPNRDSIERLSEYIGFFNSEFIAVTGEHAQLFPMVRSMGMMYAISESTDNPNYLVDHSGSVVVINPQGNVVGRFKPEVKAGQLSISDVDQIKADMPAIIDGSY